MDVLNDGVRVHQLDHSLHVLRVAQLFKRHLDCLCFLLFEQFPPVQLQDRVFGPFLEEVTTFLLCSDRSLPFKLLHSELVLFFDFETVLFELDDVLVKEVDRVFVRVQGVSNHLVNVAPLTAIFDVLDIGEELACLKPIFH